MDLTVARKAGSDGGVERDWRPTERSKICDCFKNEYHRNSGASSTVAARLLEKPIGRPYTTRPLL